MIGMNNEAHIQRFAHGEFRFRAIEHIQEILRHGQFGVRLNDGQISSTTVEGGPASGRGPVSTGVLVSVGVLVSLGEPVSVVVLVSPPPPSSPQPTIDMASAIWMNVERCIWKSSAQSYRA